LVTDNGPLRAFTLLRDAGPARGFAAGAQAVPVSRASGEVFGAARIDARSRVKAGAEGGLLSSYSRIVGHNGIAPVSDIRIVRFWTGSASYD
jgi:hypothetical protein